MIWIVTVAHPSIGKGAFTCDTLQEAIAYAEAAATRALRPGGAPGFFHATIDHVESYR